MRRGWDHLDITARRVRMNCYYVWFQYVPILPVSFLMTPVELKCRNVRPMRYAPVVGNFWKISKRSTLWTLMDSTDSKIDVWLLVDVIYLSHFIAYAVCHQVNLMRIVVFHAEFRLEIAFSLRDWSNMTQWVLCGERRRHDRLPLGQSLDSML